jgi:DNA repair protein RadC
MDIDYTVGEVELSYKPKFKSLHQVTCSEDAYKYLLPIRRVQSVTKNTSKYCFLTKPSKF